MADNGDNDERTVADEDFINKSLLDSLDAQADAEPISSSSDSDQPIATSYLSDSSSGSPSVQYHLAMQAQHSHLGRSDSPTDNASQTMMHHLHSQDPSYNIHGQQGLYNNSSSSNNVHISEYAAEYDVQRQQQPHGKVNGFGASSSSRASFSMYPNTTRARHNPPSGLNSAQFRDAPPFYPTSTADIFNTAMTSPIQPHMQTYDTRSGYDISSGQQIFNAVRPAGFASDAYAHPSIHPSHQNPGKLQQQSHSGYLPSGQYANIHLSSQTPYGPHVPSAVTTSLINGTTTVAGPASGLSGSSGMAPNPVNPSAAQEEISTIFVVGFPEDMQEREFQNMFTFSPGFEAATLKIPNRDSTAYNSLTGPTVPSRGGYQGYGGQNDPYNLVTVNQGGVVVDGGRDGTMTSWPTSAPVDEAASNTHFLGMNMPPRKQIIGFAKFKSREEALNAREILQGRRVDIEKGAVLKAEMAKKNLHTKRGVGPVPPAGPNGSTTVNGGVLPPALSSASVNGMSIMNGVGISGPAGLEYFAPDHSRDGLNNPNSGVRSNQWRESMQDAVVGINREEEDRRREGAINAMGLSALRGARERAEEEERRRKERSRPNNSTAFEVRPIGSMPPAMSSRQISGVNGVNGTSFLPAPTENGSGLGSSPLLASVYASQHTLSQLKIHQNQLHQQQDEIVGPWDRKILTSNIAPGPSSQRSNSPPQSHSHVNPHAVMENARPFTPLDGQLYYEVESQARHQHAYSESSSSSVTGSQSVIGSNAASSGADGEMSRAIDGLALNTSNGNTSPQLPSPASGASSTSARNAVDQNPPINTLYVGNLPTSPPPLGYPQDYLEESLRELFSIRPGFRRLCFRQKSNGPMCFVEFEDVPFATRALNDLYGNTLKGLIKGGGIRLSYSKNPLGVRTPTSAASSNGSTMQQQQLQSATNSLQNFVPESFPTRIEDQPRRREALPLASPPLSSQHSYNNTYLASPPPRFFSTSPSTSQFTPSSTTLTSSSTAFVPRNSSIGSYPSYSLATSSGLGNAHSTFSPFGMTSPTSNSIPGLSSASDDHLTHSSQPHFIHHRTLSPSVSNLEAARAG